MHIHNLLFQWRLQLQQQLQMLPQRWRMFLIALGAIAFATGSVVAVRAQQPICRDFDNLTVCGDGIFEQDGVVLLFSDPGRPGVTIAPKGGSPVLVIDGITDPTTNLPLKGQFAAVPAGSPAATLNGGRHTVIGGIRFAEDTANTAPLLTTRQLSDLGGPAASGYMLVDTVQRRLTLPPANAPFFAGSNLPPAVNFRFKFLERPDLLGLSNGSTNGSTDGAIRVGQMNYEFDLNSKKFSAVVPIEPTADDAERPFSAAVTMRINIDHKGVVSGTVDAFKVKVAGLIGSAEQIKIANGGMEAAFVNFSKVDNPDLPNFDPTNQSLIFQLQKLQYKNKKFTIGGGAVGIKDWEFGEGFKMVNQTIGVSFDEATQSTFFQINSSLQTKRLIENGNSLPVAMRVTRRVVGGVGKPVVEAGIANFTPTLGGVMKANLKNVKLVLDSVRNFYGLTAETAELQYPAHLGGRVAAGVSGFKLGIDKDKKPIFSLGNGTIGLPEFESKVLKGSLAGTVGMVGQTLQFTLTGNLTVLLPKNSGVGTTANMIFRSGPNVCAPNQSSLSSVPIGPVTGGSATCLKRYEQTLSGFNIKLVGFEFNLVNPRGLEDGGFAVDEAGFKMPTIFNRADSASTGLSVKGLRIAGDGKVTVTGGSFELAPFKIGDKQFVGVKGAFESLPEGGYKFVAGGTFPIGGLEASANGTAIGATITVRVNPDDSLGGGVEVFFQATPGKGMRIGSTGAEITRIGGGFSINDGSAFALTFSIRASTLARLPSPINLPILTADGNVTLQFAPTKLTANAKLSLLIFQIAQANVGIGQGVAFNNTAPGFHADMSVNVFIVNGAVKVDVGKTTVNGVEKTRVQASANVKLGIKENTFGFIPRNDLTLAGVSLAGGHFKDNRAEILGGGVERFGLKGTVEVVGLEKSVFVDIGSGPAIDLIVLGVNNIDPISAQTLRARAAQGMVGYSSVASVNDTSDTSNTFAAPRLFQDSLPIVLTQTTKLVAGIAYESGTGTPILRLRLPNGSELTKNNVLSPTTRYGIDTGNGGTYEGFQISEAAPGSYQLIIENAPVSYTAQIEQLNIVPKLQNVSVSCGDAAIAGVSLTCGGLPSNVPPGSATIRWNASDVDSPEAEVRVGYAVVTDSNAAIVDGTIDYSQIHLITDSLPLGNGQFTWAPSDVSTGKYKLVVIVEDNANKAIWQVGSTVIDIVDGKAPAVPTGLTSIPGPAEMLVNWTQNSEADLAGYEIGFGIVNDGKPDTPNNFVYFRDMGPKEVLTETSRIVDGKIWGLADNEPMYYSIRAYDMNGNRSDWAPVQFSKPWALAPKGVSPLPKSISNTTQSAIEIAFATPIVSNTLDSALTVLDSDGTIVQGQLEYLLDLSGENILGLRLVPHNGLRGNTEYRVTLNAGVQAQDGRALPSAFKWNFVTGQPGPLFMPLLGR